MDELQGRLDESRFHLDAMQEVVRGQAEIIHDLSARCFLLERALSKSSRGEVWN